VPHSSRLDGGTGTPGRFKDHSQPTVWRAFNFVRANVAMMLAVSHDNAQFIRLPFNGVFLSVHGAEVEHSGSSRFAFERLGHPRQNLKDSSRRNGKVPRFTGTGCDRG